MKTMSVEHKGGQKVFFTDGYGTVNLGYLQMEYEIGRLLDAHVFAELFQIRKDSNFKQSENFPLDFIQWNVSFSDWFLFILFLKNGKISNDKDNLENLHKLCHKFGGIPSFDVYYETAIKKREKIPIMPAHDISNEFDWRIVKHWETTFIQSLYNSGWCAVFVMYDDYLVLRRPKSQIQSANT